MTCMHGWDHEMWMGRGGMEEAAAEYRTLRQQDTEPPRSYFFLRFAALVE